MRLGYVLLGPFDGVEKSLKQEFLWYMVSGVEYLTVNSWVFGFGRSDRPRRLPKSAIMIGFQIRSKISLFINGAQPSVALMGMIINSYHSRSWFRHKQLHLQPEAVRRDRMASVAGEKVPHWLTKQELTKATTDDIGARDAIFGFCDRSCGTCRIHALVRCTVCLIQGSGVYDLRL